MSIMNCPHCGTRYDSDLEDDCPALDEDHPAPSILKHAADGLCKYIGFVDGDPRKVDVWLDLTKDSPTRHRWFVAIDGQKIGHQGTKSSGETLALLWLSAHPLEAAHVS